MRAGMTRRTPMIAITPNEKTPRRMRRNATISNRVFVSKDSDEGGGI
jgi:hypothetical protein